jgi:hypothetical protein
MKQFFAWLQSPRSRLPLIFVGLFALGGVAVLPVWYTGTASIGPGGVVDYGSVDADGSGPGGFGDPQIYNKNANGLNISAATNGSINLINCLTSGCTSSNRQQTLNVSAAAMTGLVPILAVPSPSASPGPDNPTPGPVAPCYRANGNPCNLGWHVVYDFNTLTITSNCATLTTCAVSGNTSALQGNGKFVSAQTYSCSAMNESVTNVIPVFEAVDGSDVAMTLFNNSATTIASTGTYNVNWSCHGY